MYQCIKKRLVCFCVFQIMFSRAEALHAHGYTRHACSLAIQLADEMLEKPPVLDAPPPTGLSNRVRGMHMYYKLEKYKT